MAAYIPRLFMETDDARLRRLKYRAWHRGFREADLILGPFAETHGPALPPEELDAFERLLDQPDQDIYEWILERLPTPPEFDGPVMNKLKVFCDKAHESGHGG